MFPKELSSEFSGLWEPQGLLTASRLAPCAELIKTIGYGLIGPLSTV